jgi:hypothetical protein
MITNEGFITAVYIIFGLKSLCDTLMTDCVYGLKLLKHKLKRQ